MQENYHCGRVCATKQLTFQLPSQPPCSNDFGSHCLCFSSCFVPFCAIFVNVSPFLVFAAFWSCMTSIIFLLCRALHACKGFDVFFTDSSSCFVIFSHGKGSGADRSRRKSGSKVLRFPGSTFPVPKKRLPRFPTARFKDSEPQGCTGSPIARFERFSLESFHQVAIARFQRFPKVCNSKVPPVR